MKSSLSTVCASTSISSYESFDNVLKARAMMKKPPKNIIITEDILVNQKMAKKNTRQEIASRKADQQLLDLDVILGVFLRRPNANFVVKKLLEILNTPMSEVRSYHQFEGCVDSFGKSSHHIVVTFKEKSTKLKVIDAKVSLSLEQLVEKHSEGYHPKITCRNRLTKFNSAIERQLKKLLSKGIIKEFRFSGFLFSFKSYSSDWKVVEHHQILEPYFEMMRLKNEIAKQMREAERLQASLR
jgi:hypothetical protein